MKQKYKLELERLEKLEGELNRKIAFYSERIKDYNDLTESGHPKAINNTPLIDYARLEVEASQVIVDLTRIELNKTIEQLKPLHAMQYAESR